MDNPVTDISHILTQIFSPFSPDSQVDAIKKYFTSDASLSHPFCFVDSAPDSRDRIIRAYFCLKIATSMCSAKIRRQSFNDVKGKMALELQVTPTPRGFHNAVVKGLEWEPPTIPVYCFLTLRRENGVVGAWRIHKQEFIFQPIDVLIALNLLWLGRALYYFLWLIIVTTVLAGQIARVWKHKEFSVQREITTTAKDGYQILVLDPAFSVASALARAKNDVRNGLNHFKRHHAGRIAAAKLAWRVMAWKTVGRVIR